MKINKNVFREYDVRGIADVDFSGSFATCLGKAFGSYVIRKKTLESLEYLFDENFHIIGDFDLNLRIAKKWKIDCIQSPVATARIHGKNESLLKKEQEID